MRRMPAHDNIVSLLSAFNLIGRHAHTTTWDESEASAIRLGRAAKASSESRHRGRDALRLMRQLAENGTINLIYTDDQRRRVPYFQSPGYWLTAIYPDPIATGEGMIELDDRYIYLSVVDIRQITKWQNPIPNAATGPKRRFLPFEAELDKYFSFNPISNKNTEVISDLRHSSTQFDWPKKTMMYEFINDARDRAKARIWSSAIPE